MYIVSLLSAAYATLLVGRCRSVVSLYSAIGVNPHIVNAFFDYLKTSSFDFRVSSFNPGFLIIGPQAPELLC